MMTTEDFNKKYSDYLEAGHYGLAIDNEDVIDIQIKYLKTS